MKYLYINFKWVVLFFLVIVIFSQNKTNGQGRLSGDYVINANIYDRDDRIGTNTTHYLREMSSADSWLFLNYRLNNFQFSTRFDMFHNSPLFNPEEAFTGQGIGFYSASVDVAELNITAGMFYEQIGSGILFRAYEDRLLGLDYALEGVRLRYRISDGLSIMAFTGLQKYRFDRHEQVIKGINTEFNHYFEESEISLLSGIGFLNRTLDRETMNRIADEINSYELEDRFIPKYNLYGMTIYNNLSFKRINWYAEVAAKTSEAVRNFDGVLQDQDGFVLYSVLNYSMSGFGVSLQYKRNEHFVMRTTPYTSELVGIMNYMPPLSKQHSYRLPARYSTASFESGEEGVQASVTYSPDRKNTFTANFSYSTDLDNNHLFREYYLDYSRRFSTDLKTVTGIQSVLYNQDVFEGKPGVPLVETITPFIEVVYRISRKHSLKTELQYLFTEQDYGHFAYALIEFNIVPNWSFAVSDMYNIKPLLDDEPIHYYSIFTSYRVRQTQFMLSYVKQVEGIVCTGGVCRLEPAFSGLRFSLTTNF